MLKIDIHTHMLPENWPDLREKYGYGGFVRLDRVEDRDVFLEMGGGCQGCSASRVTLREGIEQAIRQACPQVREVVDITDHDAGENPYYS